MKHVRFFALAILPVFFLVSCGRNDVKPDEDTVLEVKEYKTVMKTGDVLVDPVHGKEVSFWYGAVLGVQNENANGVGYIRLFEDGVTVTTVNLNIFPRTDGKVFVAWLAKEDDSDPIQMGELGSIIGDARHSAKFETKDGMEGRTKILVSLESSVNVAAPGGIVAEGVLKQPDPQ